VFERFVALTIEVLEELDGFVEDCGVLEGRVEGQCKLLKDKYSRSYSSAMLY
jgi:hypothetical protein